MAITPSENARHAIQLTITSEIGSLPESRVLSPAKDGTITATIDDLAPGAYTIEVSGARPPAPFAAVSSDILIWDDTAAR